MNNRVNTSVIIPTYNRAHILSKTLESVLNQTIDDYEIIIVDDCSTDNTVEFMNNFNNHKIKFIRHQKQEGGGAARNTGVQHSSGRYLAFLDSDDIWYPTKLEKQLNKFKNSSKDTGLIYTWLAYYEDDNFSFYKKSNFKGKIYKNLLIKNVVGTTSSVITKRHIFDSVQGFDVNLPAKQDQDLWIRIAKKYKIDFIPEVLVRVNQLKSSERITNNKDALYTARKMFLNKYRDDLMAENLCHLYLCKLAQFHYFYFNDKKRARQYFIEALSVKKLSVRPYIFLFFISILPSKVYRNFRLFSRKLIGRR
jgi:glycosyltransferase involved in cell wall biosynthesis